MNETASPAQSYARVFSRLRKRISDGASTPSKLRLLYEAVGGEVLRGQESRSIDSIAKERFKSLFKRDRKKDRKVIQLHEYRPIRKAITDNPTEPTPATLGARFSDFLRQNKSDAKPDEIGPLLDQFLRFELPEIDALDAVRELRAQFRSQKVEQKEPYPGKRKAGDPIAFLIKHYGDEIRSGQVAPGRFVTIDKPLYLAVRNELLRERVKRSLGQLFDDIIGKGPRPRAYKRRVEACAAILESSELEAGKFFGGVRADRIAENQTFVERVGEGRPKRQSRF